MEYETTSKKSFRDFLEKTFNVATIANNIGGALKASPISFPGAGTYKSNGIPGSNGSGYYWENNVSKTNITYASDMYFTDNRLNTMDASPRGNGMSLRCLAR